MHGANMKTADPCVLAHDIMLLDEGAPDVSQIQCFQNSQNHSPTDRASYPGRNESSDTPLSECQIVYKTQMSLCLSFFLNDTSKQITAELSVFKVMTCAYFLYNKTN